MWQSLHISLLSVLVITKLFPTVTQDEIDDVINSGVSCRPVTGLAVAVVKDGNVVLSKGYGVRNIDSGDPVTSSTLFGIASLSKAFTTTLLSKVLEDQSRYDINDNLYKFLGRNRFNTTLRSIYATVEDLMAHRMGIPRNNYIRLDDTLTRDNLVDRMKYLKHKGGFRDSFYYSDLMYGLQTHITEEVAGRVWEDVMTDEIFTPLHMDSSTFGTRVNFSAPNVATPYVSDQSRLVVASSEFLRHWALIGGSGAVVSNADDMSKWMLFLLSGGKNEEGVQVVEEDVLQETFKPRNSLRSSSINKYFSRPDTPVTMSNDQYGLGWKTGYYRGLPLIQHSGTTFGYRNFLSLIPSENLGVFVTMSGSDPEFYFRGSLSTYLMDVYLGETPWINSSTICSFPRPWHQSSGRRSTRRRRGAIMSRRARNARLPLTRYSGVYRNEAYGNINVTYDSTNNKLKATYGIGSWVLASRGGDSFRANWDKPAPSLDFNFKFFQSRGIIYKLVPTFETKLDQIFFRI